MKLQIIFNTQAECDAYFGGGEIPSKYLVIIKEVELPSGEIVTNSLLSTTNNIIEEGEAPESVETGASAISYSYSMSYAYIIVEEDYSEIENAYSYLWADYQDADTLSYEILTDSPSAEEYDAEEEVQ